MSHCSWYIVVNGESHFSYLWVRLATRSLSMTCVYLPCNTSFIHMLNEPLHPSIAEHHRTLAGTHFAIPWWVGGLSWPRMNLGRCIVWLAHLPVWWQMYHVIGLLTCVLAGVSCDWFTYLCNGRCGTWRRLSVKRQSSHMTIRLARSSLHEECCLAVHSKSSRWLTTPSLQSQIF